MKHSFFDFEVYQSVSTDIPAAAFLGQNEKNLLLVLKEEDFSEENEQFLTKILAAVKHDLNKDALRLILPKGQSYGINEFLKSESINHIILFGVNPKDLGLSIEPIVYKKFSLQKKHFLITHPLEKIKKTQELKKALWASLQEIFLTPQK